MYDVKMQLSQKRVTPKLLSTITFYFLDKDPLTNSWEQIWGLSEGCKRPAGYIEHEEV